MARHISTLVVDLETICGSSKPTPEEVKPPSNYKKIETIEAYKNNPDNIDKEWRKQALIPTVGRVHTIGYKLGTEPTKELHHDGSNEEDLFKRWEENMVKTFEKHYGNGTIYGVTLIGFNIKSFDAPWIWLRLRKFKCTSLLKIIGATPQDVRIEDVMRWMVFNSYRDFCSMDKAYQFFFGKSAKGDMDGSKVHDAWLAGEHQKIADYCIDDVDKTYALAVALGIIIPE